MHFRLAKLALSPFGKEVEFRNRRLGDFLKELDLTEGRSTGVPTIQEKLADNGSPRATFETTEDRLTFLIHIPIHAGCGNKPATEKTIGDYYGEKCHRFGEKWFWFGEKFGEKPSNHLCYNAEKRRRLRHRIK